MDLALNNLQRLICYKTKPKKKKITLCCLSVISAPVNKYHSGEQGVGGVKVLPVYQCNVLKWLKERIHKTCLIIELYTSCSMNQQYVEGVQNRKKSA